MRSRHLALVLALAWVAAPGSAGAHRASFTYASLDLSQDRREARYELRISAGDLFEALALAEDREATDREITDGATRLFDYVQDRVDLEAPRAECRLERRGVDVVADERRHARLALGLVCAEPIVEIAVDYGLFFDLDPAHIGFLAVEGRAFLLTGDKSRFVWTVGEPPPSGLAGFLRSGIDHIFFGPDHILFLFSLLLMAVVTRSERGGFRLRPLKEGLVYTGVIVTAFTIAHSATLVAAALGRFDLPERLVESVIAGSIIYVAVENVVRPDPPRRYLVTFLFGLIHGLGFASMLRPLLPPEGVVLPLLAFNLGVEVGQLAIVAVSVPLLYLLAHRIGADRYRRWVLPVGGAALAAAGLLWLVERAFDLAIVGF